MTILDVTVTQEAETGAYVATWRTPEGDGQGGYSATPIGAVASALHTMILVAEDRVRDLQAGDGSEGR